SSRRRHTRSTRDWSSDMCSSDLIRVREDEQAGCSGRHVELDPLRSVRDQPDRPRRRLLRWQRRKRRWPGARDFDNRLVRRIEEIDRKSVVEGKGGRLSGERWVKK